MDRHMDGRTGCNIYCGVLEWAA